MKLPTQIESAQQQNQLISQTLVDEDDPSPLNDDDPSPLDDDFIPQIDREIPINTQKELRTTPGITSPLITT